MKAARDGFDEPLDNEAIKQMSYMDKKKQLVDAFGTSKSKKKVTSMMTNMVDEGGITNQQGKGVRDARLAKKAQVIADKQEELQHDLLSLADRRQHLYSRDRLLPSELLAQMPYKLTFEALANEDEESFRKLIYTTMVRDSLIYFYQSRF